MIAPSASSTSTAESSAAVGDVGGIEGERVSTDAHQGAGADAGADLPAEAGTLSTVAAAAGVDARPAAGADAGPAASPASPANEMVSHEPEAGTDAHRGGGEAAVVQAKLAEALENCHAQLKAEREQIVVRHCCAAPSPLAIPEAHSHIPPHAHRRLRSRI